MSAKTEFHTGQGVVYRAHLNAAPEDGIVTAVTDSYVFVRYRGDNHSKATRPVDLRPLQPSSDERQVRGG